MSHTPPGKLATLRFDGEKVASVGYQLPQIIYISGPAWYSFDRDIVVVRPLTTTALVRGVGGNFVRMAYWRGMVTLRILGLLNTPELGRLSWRHLNATPWRYSQLRRLWPARLYRTVRRRLA